MFLDCLGSFFAICTNSIVSSINQAAEACVVYIKFTLSIYDKSCK